METITIKVMQEDVYEEVAKATDYTGSKLVSEDEGARDRILAADDDLASLGRFWEESVVAANEDLKEMLLTGRTKAVAPSGKTGYEAVLEVSKAFDKELTASVETTLRSFFIASIIGQWFKFANKEEAKDYFGQAAEMLLASERLLYSRRRPRKPTAE